jgi:hypothetical protein
MMPPLRGTLRHRGTYKALATRVGVTFIDVMIIMCKRYHVDRCQILSCLDFAPSLNLDVFVDRFACSGMGIAEIHLARVVSMKSDTPRNLIGSGNK